MKIKGFCFIIALACFGCNSSNKKVSPELSASMTKGLEIYNSFCLNCHMTDGNGVENVIPPINNSDYLKNLEATIRSTKYGLKGEVIVNGKTYNSVMPPMGLSDEEIANVMNYIYNSWGNNRTILVTEEQVLKIKR